MQQTGELFLKSSWLCDRSRHSGCEASQASPASREYALIVSAQNGNLTAFNDLVMMYQNDVYRQAFWMLKEQEAAEDATQEAFIKAYRKIRTFVADKPFRPWLLKIATNHCLDMIRASRRHQNLSLELTNSDDECFEASWMEDPAETPEQMVERAEAENRIIRAIQRLAPEYKTVVILVDLQGLDYGEASAVLGVPLGTMKSRLSRARNQLRQALL